VSDLALDELLRDLADDDVDDVVLLGWVGREVRLKVMAEKVTTTTQLLVSTRGTLMSMFWFLLTCVGEEGPG
jgi:hypothetical protein